MSVNSQMENWINEKFGYATEDTQIYFFVVFIIE